MTKTYYTYQNKHTKEFSFFKWDNDMGVSNFFLWSKRIIDVATLYENENDAKAAMKTCSIFDSNPHKEDWELIAVEVSYTILPK